MISMSEVQVRRFGGSVAGSSAPSRGNQDAWAGGRFRIAGGTTVHFLVVCDGLGSCLSGREGALAAVRATRKAVRLWGAVEGAGTGTLTRLIELLWRLEVTPHDPRQWATTCLVSVLQVRTDASELTVVTLGDGLVLVRAEKTLTVIGGRGDTFVNQTIGLGIPHRMEAWRERQWTPVGAFTLVLCTDGVADDLRREALPEFVDWLEPLAQGPPRTAGSALRRALRDWPVPQHSDDKTVAVLLARMT
jgi:serine/threonine protein phosphatase PrpC